MKKINKNVKPMVLFGLFILTYAPTFWWMWDRWFVRDSYYSHGILIPFVSAYLIWQKKDELIQARYVFSPWGIRLILLGLVIHFFSSVLRIYFSSGFSILVVLSGLIIHSFGSDVFRKIVFPVFFLFFMIPLPSVVIVNLSFKMKLFAAEIAKSILNQMGLQAVRAGSIIKLPHTYVIVDDVCSGLRSLIALMALGSIFAYWFKGAMGKRLILFFSTIPVAVVTNVCRVVFLATVSEVWGAENAKGLVHDVSGFLVFALAFGMLYMIGRLVE